MTCGMLCVMRREGRGVLHLGKYSPPKGFFFWGGGGGGGGEKKKREMRFENRSLRERDSTFSLNFPAIGPAVSSGARGRVHPHNKGFA